MEVCHYGWRFLILWEDKRHAKAKGYSAKMQLSSLSFEKTTADCERNGWMTDGCVKNPFPSQSAVVFYAGQTAAQHGQRSDDDEAVNHQWKEEGDAGGDGEGDQAA